MLPPTRFITRIFMVIPDGTHWTSVGILTNIRWSSKPRTVVLTLPDLKKWACVNYLQPFPEDNVEFCVAEAFARLPQYKDTFGNVVT